MKDKNETLFYVCTHTIQKHCNFYILFNLIILTWPLYIIIYDTRVIIGKIKYCRERYLQALWRAFPSRWCNYIPKEKQNDLCTHTIINNRETFLLAACFLFLLSFSFLILYIIYIIFIFILYFLLYPFSFACLYDILYYSLFVVYRAFYGLIRQHKQR